MSNNHETFELFHYIASLILLCATCVTDVPLWEQVINFTILEKYGFVVLLLIILQGSSHYAERMWGVVSKIFERKGKK